MENNSILHETLSHIAHTIAPEERYRLFIKEKGAFDYRALHVLQYVCSNLRAVNRGSRNYDTWLYPYETLAAGGGDCEDLAFLIAALLVASGISPYMVRVAFGYVRESGSKKETARVHQHAWVMYRAESGSWMLFDPLAMRVPTRQAKNRTGKKRATSLRGVAQTLYFEYIPLFVMNSDHVWRVDSPRYNETLPAYMQKNYSVPESFWRTFNPSFNADTHYNVFVQALYDTGLFSSAELFFINAASLAIDADIGLYHPFDHFDNGYIDEGWNRVHERLLSGNIVDFAHAMHAVADFYAHSSYGHFFLDAKKIPLYEADVRKKDLIAGVEEVYANSPAGQNMNSLNMDHFSSHANKDGHVRPTSEREFWKSQIVISGRYALPEDSMEGAFSFGRITAYPNELQTSVALKHRRWLPHHNEIAVDSATMSSSHKLYNADTYSREYTKRMDAAVRHTMILAKEWKGKGVERIRRTQQQ